MRDRYAREVLRAKGMMNMASPPFLTNNMGQVPNIGQPVPPPAAPYTRADGVLNSIKLHRELEVVNKEVLDYIGAQVTMLKSAYKDNRAVLDALTLIFSAGLREYHKQNIKKEAGEL